MDTEAYLPLAKAETSKFYAKLERARFRYDELLSVAVEDLARAPNAKWAKTAIKGALTDYVRDAYKLVRDVEMSEDEYLRTWGSPNPPPACIRRVYVLDGVRHTLYTPGVYRSNAKLLLGDYKVSSKHGKVSVALARSAYNDGWSQSKSAWNRAQIDGEDDELDFNPRVASALPTRGEVNQIGYLARGKEKRFSASYLNNGSTRSGRSDREYGEGKIEVTNPNPPQNPFYIPRRANSELAPHARGRFTLRTTGRGLMSEEDFRAIMDYFGERLPEAESAMWQREAGYFRLELGPLDRPNQRGGNWLRAYLDRWEPVRSGNFVYLRLKGNHEQNLMSDVEPKSDNWADVLNVDSLEQGIPRRPALERENDDDSLAACASSL
jgi:hypothetical protein